MNNKHTPFGLPGLYDENGQTYKITVYHGTDTSALQDIVKNGFPVIENGAYYGQQFFLNRFFVTEKITDELITQLRYFIPKFGKTERSDKKQGVYFEFDNGFNTAIYATAATEYSGGGEFMNTSIDLLQTYFNTSLKEITPSMKPMEKAYINDIKHRIPVIIDALKPEFQDIQNFKQIAIQKFHKKSKPIVVEFKIPVTELINSQEEFEQKTKLLKEHNIKSEDSAHRLFGVNNCIRISVPASDVIAIHDYKSIDEHGYVPGTRYSVSEYMKKHQTNISVKNAIKNVDNIPIISETKTIKTSDNQRS